MQILSVQENWDQIKQIIAVLLVAWTNNDILVQQYDLHTSDHIEEFLGLQTGNFNLYLVDMASLISWDLEGKQKTQILHASFCDFLLDPTRSKEFSCSEKAMNTMMACFCLQHLINLPKQNPTESELCVLL